MGSGTDRLLDLIRLIANGATDRARRMLELQPELARLASPVGADRTHEEYFLEPIRRWLYAGDTAIHIGAAAFQPEICTLLIEAGADCRARNRRGAEPIHYACDANHWNPGRQAETIACLIAAGADPNALDRDGTAPIHRAVRTRSAAAVRSLLDAGADIHLRNGNGSTPLHLAVRPTGRGGSGSALALQQQASILALLLARGARLDERDARGVSALEIATASRRLAPLVGAAPAAR